MFSAIFHCPLCLMSTYLIPNSRSEHVHYNRQVLQGSTVSANRQSQASPATHSAKGQVLTAHHPAARLQWAQRHFRWGDSSGLGFYSLMSLGLTLVIMTVEFEFLEEEGNVLLITVSLRGTDLEVGVLWYGVALWTEGRQPHCSRLH